jgi:hypothetical protein
MAKPGAHLAADSERLLVFGELDAVQALQRQATETTVRSLEGEEV